MKIIYSVEVCSEEDDEEGKLGTVDVSDELEDDDDGKLEEDDDDGKLEEDDDELEDDDGELDSCEEDDT